MSNVVWGAHIDGEDDFTDRLAKAFAEAAKAQGLTDGTDLDDAEEQFNKAFQHKEHVAKRRQVIEANVRGIIEKVGGTVEDVRMAKTPNVIKAIKLEAQKGLPYTSDHERALTFTVHLPQSYTIFAATAELARIYEPAGQVFDGHTTKTYWTGNAAQQGDTLEPFEFAVVFVPARS